MSAEATKKALEECSNKLGDPKTPDFSMEKANTIRDLARNLDDRMAWLNRKTLGFLGWKGGDKLDYLLEPAVASYNKGKGADQFTECDTIAKKAKEAALIPNWSLPNRPIQTTTGGLSNITNYMQGPHIAREKEALSSK